MHKVKIPQDVIDHVMNRQGRLHTYESIDGEATALVVVDMQNHFLMEGMPSCCPVAREIVPNVNRLAKAVRGGGGLVVWIQTQATEESFTGWANSYERFLPERLERRTASLNPGGEGYELWADLEIEPEDARVIKSRYSAIIEGSSDLEAVLREGGIATVLITGVATNVCCESTARDAQMRGFRTLMVSDGNATTNDAAHNATLATFLAYFGDVQSTDEVIEHLNPGAAKPSQAAE